MSEFTQAGLGAGVDEALFSFFLCCLAITQASSAAQAADRILVASLAPNKAALYVSQADGSGEHALLPPGTFDYNASWSPKGDWIAFTSERAGSAELYRVHPDGKGVERLTADPAYDDQAAFSPDEKQIVFVSTRAAGFANLWVLDIATHKARPHLRSWRRFPASLVAGRELDRLFFRSRQ